ARISRLFRKASLTSDARGCALAGMKHVARQIQYRHIISSHRSNAICGAKGRARCGRRNVTRGDWAVRVRAEPGTRIPAKRERPVGIPPRSQVARAWVAPDSPLQTGGGFGFRSPRLWFYDSTNGPGAPSRPAATADTRNSFPRTARS